MEILLWPNPLLKQVCTPVDLAVDDADTIQRQLDGMLDTVKKAGGVGLAANQVGLTKRLVVARPAASWRTFVNPRIVGFTGEWTPKNEGCLSVPGFFEKVKRNTGLVVEHLDLASGTVVVEDAPENLAHILQHEIEHLDGNIFLEKLPRGAYDRWRAAMRKRR